MLIRDESREVTVMMSTQENIFGEVPAELCATIDVVGVQMENKGPEKMNKIELRSRASGKRESDYVEENRRQKIHRITALENTTPHDDLKKRISFIHPNNWTSKQETGKKPEKI